MNKVKIAGLGIIIGLISACGVSSSSSSSTNSMMNNMVATMEVKEPIEGVCDNSAVYAILPFKGNGQIKAIASMTDEEIEKLLNTQVEFLKDKPKYKDKGMVGLVVNCKGEMVKCEIDNETKNPELDKQIVAVFNELKKWVPASMRGNNVDSSILYSFTIEDGKISL